MKYLVSTILLVLFALSSSFAQTSTDKTANRIIAKFEKFVTLTAQQKEKIVTLTSDAGDFSAMNKEDRRTQIRTLRRQIHDQVLTSDQISKIMDEKSK